MNNNSGYKYITIPLPVIKRIYTHPKTGISDIFDVGIYKVSTYGKINEYEAIKQVFYSFCREKKSLPLSLYSRLETLISDGTIESIDDYYCGFDADGDFDPSDAIRELLNYIEELEEYAFLNEIKEFHGMRATKNVLKMRYDIPAVMKSAKSILSKIPPKEPLITIKTEMMFDYYKNKKSAYEKDMFTCYLGIRSIIGRKEYSATTKEMILCRMIGCSSPSKLKEALKVKELKKVYAKYSSQYSMDKLLDNLVKYKFITKIGVKPLRRTFVSTKLDLTELTYAIKEDLSKGEVKNNKKLERNAANEILSSLRK